MNTVFQYIVYNNVMNNMQYRNSEYVNWWGTSHIDIDRYNLYSWLIVECLCAGNLFFVSRQNNARNENTMNFLFCCNLTKHQGFHNNIYLHLVLCILWIKKVFIGWLRYYLISCITCKYMFLHFQFLFNHHLSIFEISRIQTM